MRNRWNLPHDPRRRRRQEPQEPEPDPRRAPAEPPREQPAGRHGQRDANPPGGIMDAEATERVQVQWSEDDVPTARIQLSPEEEARLANARIRRGEAPPRPPAPPDRRR